MSSRTFWMVVILIAVVAGASLLAISMLQATNPSSPFRRVALMVTPAVVNIAADKVVAFRLPRQNELDDFLQRDPQANPNLRHQHMLGTGFIFDARGYVMTNYHVISGYDDIVIRLADGTEFASESIRKVGVDPWSDLAVLKIETKRRLPTVRLGNSDQLNVGDWVAAVGNPFGLSGTLTAGIVSAINRSGIPIAQGPKFQDFIQTDASINPGNSGGPLVNEAGEVVGVNSAIRSPIQGSVGIGFAVPVNFASDVAAELIRTGRIVRGYVGINTQPIEDQIQEALDLKTRDGVLVSSVTPNGPGASAGVQAGDVILRFDNQDVGNVQDFQALTAGASPGSTVDVELRRWGKPLAVKLKVLPRTDAEPRPLPEPKTQFWLGLGVRSLTAEEMKRLGRTSGVVVNLVEPGGPADNAQLRTGDILLAIDNYGIADLTSYRKLETMMKRSRKALLLYVQRGREAVYFAVGPGE